MKHMQCKKLIDVLTPTHSQASCTDQNSNGNEYVDERGFAQCNRCMLLYLAREHKFPFDANITDFLIRFDRNRKGLI